MPRFCSLLLLWLVLGAGWLPAQELPEGGRLEELEKGAGDLLDNLPDLSSQPSLPEAAALEAKNTLSVAEAEARLARARRKQARWEKLCQAGVLSRAEVETAIFEAGEALVRCQQARRARAQEELAGVCAGWKDPAFAVETLALRAGAEAQAAGGEAQWQRLQLELAQSALDRCLKLYAARLINRHELEKAQGRVARLQAAAPRR